MLKTADPTVCRKNKILPLEIWIKLSTASHDLPIVPMPISPSVIKVPITFTNSSGALVAAAINVAPATSLDIFRAMGKGHNCQSLVLKMAKY